MKKCAIIVELADESKNIANEKLREEIKTQLDKQIEPVMPWMKRVIEVVVWTET